MVLHVLRGEEARPMPVGRQSHDRHRPRFGRGSAQPFDVVDDTGRETAHASRARMVGCTRHTGSTIIIIVAPWLTDRFDWRGVICEALRFDSDERARYNWTGCDTQSHCSGFPMPRRLVAGNWKMNGTSGTNADLLRHLACGARSGRRSPVVVCVPYPYLPAGARVARGKPGRLGCTGCKLHAQGALTRARFRRQCCVTSGRRMRSSAIRNAGSITVSR